MKKIIFLISASILFGASHGQTNDKDLQLALQGKYKEAFLGFSKRCKKKDGYACGMVGFFYDKGFGVKKDHNKAILFYKKGCELNDKDSCTLLGYYEYKTKNIKEAKKLLQKACNLGNKDACDYLNKIKNDS